MPKVLRSISEVKDFTNLYNLVNRRIGFVPTMGALHEGHLSLGRRARKESDCVIYSIYVNPIQFGPSEDLEKYPRQINEDLEKLDSIGVDAVFMPDNDIMYPEGFSTYIDIGEIGNILCGNSRPGHFRGVATVVTKLFNIVGCDQAYFGRKDLQQLIILNKIVDDLNIDVEIIGVDTVRESDGLAMSSRNSYLNAEERRAASVIYRSLTSAKKQIDEYKTSEKMVNGIKEMIGSESLAQIEYIEIRSIYDLSEMLKPLKNETVCFAAVKIGNTRLIDNIIL